MGAVHGASNVHPSCHTFFGFVVFVSSSVISDPYGNNVKKYDRITWLYLLSFEYSIRTIPSVRYYKINSVAYKYCAQFLDGNYDRTTANVVH